jgi:hypothetical protein
MIKLSGYFKAQSYVSLLATVMVALAISIFTPLRIDFTITRLHLYLGFSLFWLSLMLKLTIQMLKVDKKLSKLKAIR